MNNLPERIQKVLARLGHGSRRRIEAWIKAGRITVNGKPAKLGALIKPDDRVFIDGRQVYTKVNLSPKTRIITYHKPSGEICTRKDNQGRPTVFANLPALKCGRWVSIGRLDLTTSGLMLFTNDGTLANSLMHPSAGIEREYAVRVLGQVEAGALKQLQAGVVLKDGTARFFNIADAGGKGANHWYRVTLTEGRNHEVKRLWNSQGITVSRLIRIRFGPIILPRNSRPGDLGELDDTIINTLGQYVRATGLNRQQPNLQNAEGKHLHFVACK